MDLADPKPADIKEIFDLIDIAVFVVEVGPGDSLEFEFFNKAAEKLTGVSNEKVRGKPVDCLVEVAGAEAAARIEANYRRCLATGSPIEYEEMIPFLGRVTWWLTRLIPVFAEGRGATRIIGSATSITEMKEIEKRQARSQAMLAEAEEIANFGSFEIDTATDTIEWSPQALEMLGHPEGAVPKRMRDLFEFLGPRVAEIVVEGFRSALAGTRRFERKIELRAESALKILKVVGNVHLCFAGGRPRVVGTILDITAEESMRDELSVLGAAVKQNSASIVITDPRGEITYVNPAFEALTGYSAVEAVGKTPRILKSCLHSEDFYRTLWTTISGGGIWRGEFQNRKKNGELYWEDAVITPIRSGDGNITHYVAVKKDITELKAANSALEELATVDALTGVLNRRTGLVVLGKQISLSMRAKKPVSIAFIDVDGLKAVNDGFGHRDGDALIRTMAAHFQESIRASDTLCRMGGDEFMVVFPECGARNAEALMGRIRRSLAARPEVLSSPFAYSFSAGVEEYPLESGPDIHEFIQMADERMYAEKKLKKGNSGGN